MKTYIDLPSCVERSLEVSVLPVPAGPAGAVPMDSQHACVAVMYTRSVSGVMTRRPPLPRYSYPYGNDASQMRITLSSMSVSQYVRSCDIHLKHDLRVSLASMIWMIMSRECASMVIMFMIFWRCGFSRFLRVLAMRSLICTTCCSLYFFMALASPPFSLSNAVSTSWHQKIWFTTRPSCEDQS